MQIVATRPKAFEWKGEKVAWAHAKRDGWRLTLVINEYGIIRGYGRDLNVDLFKKYPLLYNANWVQRLVRKKVCDTIIDGELWAPGFKASIVSSMLARDSAHLLEFDVFAVPVIGGMDTRHVELENIRNIVVDKYKMRWAPYRRVSPLEKTRESFLNDVEPDSEGWVLKAAHWDGWYKVKHELTADLIVTGIKEGDGRHIGALGALIGSVHTPTGMREVANVGSGLTDKDRDELMELHDKGQLLGRVMEVKYQYVADRGRLRHPRFVRWRDDKPAAECTDDQLLA